MKTWVSYGAEHSMNLVIIGRFKTVADAEEFKNEAETLISFLSKYADVLYKTDRFDPEIRDYLFENNINYLMPQQLEQFIYSLDIEHEGRNIRIKSDDDINGFISMMIHHGAKIEIFSAHDYLESENE